MRIGILGGTGRMGKGLARQYVKMGHEVVLGSRDAVRAAEEAAAIQREVSGAKVRGVELAEAADSGELIVLSVPFGEAAGLVASLAGSLEGKIIVDITNPFGAVPVGEISGVEHNVRALGRPARWVSAYKTNFWKTLDQPCNSDGVRRDVFICSDDTEARRTVIELAEGAGFRAVDCGPLETTRTLDPMIPLMLELDKRLDGDCFNSWKLLGA